MHIGPKRKAVNYRFDLEESALYIHIYKPYMYLKGHKRLRRCALCEIGVNISSLNHIIKHMFKSQTDFFLIYLFQFIL